MNIDLKYKKWRTQQKADLNNNDDSTHDKFILLWI